MNSTEFMNLSLFNEIPQRNHERTPYFVLWVVLLKLRIVTLIVQLCKFEEFLSFNTMEL